jgi:hypothetical protein
MNMQVNDMSAFQGLAASTHSTVHNAMSSFAANVASFQTMVLNMEGLFTRAVGRRLFDNLPSDTSGVLPFSNSEPALPPQKGVQMVSACMDSCIHDHTPSIL